MLSNAVLIVESFGSLSLTALSRMSSLGRDGKLTGHEGDKRGGANPHQVRRHETARKTGLIFRIVYPQERYRTF